MRPGLEQAGHRQTLGLFDIKEHFVSVGLALLPAYWVCWRRPRADESARMRAVLTAVFAVIVWWSFLDAPGSEDMLAHLLQQILEKPECAQKLTHGDFAALTQLIWEHVNPYGRFETRHRYPIAA